MACKTCKEKNGIPDNIKDDIMDNVAKTSKIVLWVIGIWAALGLFGLISLFRLFL
jgi:hypothetical protein